MLFLYHLNVKEMKSVFVLYFVLVGMGLNAQNTRLVFSQYPIDKSGFDGDYIANYDQRKSKNDFNTSEKYFVRFHPNGQKSEEGILVNNKPDGIWKTWNENGKLLSRIKYKNGQKKGKLIVRNNSGTILAKGRYNRFGEKTGTWVCLSSENGTFNKRKF